MNQDVPLNSGTARAGGSTAPSAPPAAQHLLGRLLPGPARPHHARAAIARRIAHALGEDARDHVAVHGDVAEPAMGDSTSSSSGKMSASARRRLSVGHVGITGNRAVATAEQDAPAIGRWPIVVVQLARLAAHHALGHQRAHEVVRQRRGGDDAAAHGHEAAAQPRVELIGVAVGAHDDVVGHDRAARRRDLVAAARADAEHRRLAVHTRRAAAPARSMPA